MSSSDVVSDVSAEQLRVKSLVSEIMSILSLLGACFIVFTIIFMKYFKPHIANRVSIWLTFWKAFADIFYSIVYLISQNSVVNLATCRFVMWGYVEFTLLSIFLTCTIAFNLQAIFVNELNHIVYVQRFYVPFAVVLSLVLSLIPLCANQFTFDPMVGNCWYRDQYSSSTMVWEMTTFYGWIFLGVVYCIVAVVLVTIRLIRNEREFQMNVSPGATKLNRNINKVVTRIILYPVIPIVAQSFNFITELVTFFTRHLTFTLYFLSAVGPASIGFLNLLVFLFDPAFQRLVRELRFGEGATTQSTTHHDMDFKAETTDAFGSLFYVSGEESPSNNRNSGKHNTAPFNNIEQIKLHHITSDHQRLDSIALENDSAPLAHVGQNLFSERNSSLELILDSSDLSTRPKNDPAHQAPSSGFKSNMVRYM